jgi:hypothetical protein
LPTDEIEDGDTSDDDDDNAVETAVQLADRDPGRMPAEQTKKDNLETKSVDASAVVDSDDSKHEDADADSDRTTKEDKDGTEEAACPMESLDDNHIDLAETHTSIGLMQYHLNDFETSFDSYQEALHLC